MKREKFGVTLALFAAALGVLSPGRAFAGYLDPGTGSFLIQMAVAALLGSLLTIKLWWHNLKSFIGNLFSRATPKDPGDA